MILFLHIIFGSVWGVFMRNPWWAFLFGFVTHYFLDKLPHFEYQINGLKNGRLREATRDYLKIFLDLALGAATVYFFSHGANFRPAVWLGALGGLLPDGLVFLAWQIKKFRAPKPIAVSLQIFFNHHFNNHWDITKKVPLWLGTACISAIIIISLAALSSL